MDITGTNDGETINGTAGDDLILALGGNDIINGGAGIDVIDGGEGDDILIVGDPVLAGEEFDGHTGRDTLRVLASAAETSGPFTGFSTPIAVEVDEIEVIELASEAGGAVNTFLGTHQIGSFDEVIGGVGADALWIIALPSGGDFFLQALTLTNWDVETDVVGFAAANGSTAAFNMFLNDHIGLFYLLGADGNDHLTGSNGYEIIIGNQGNDTVRAGGGDDEIFGDEGDDYLVGDGGDDTIDGGEGGDDQAVFNMTGGLSGTLRVVAGPVSGTVIAQHLKLDGSIEDVFLITPAGPGAATVSGINSMAHFGTDTLTNIENVQIYLDNYPDPIGEGQFLGLRLYPIAYAQSFSVDGSIGDDVLSAAAYYPDATSSSGVNMRGGFGDDMLIGDSFGNYLVGEAGDDTIDGGGSHDTAAFELPRGTVGSLRLVESGTSNVFLVQLVQDDGSSQDVFQVEPTGNGAAFVTGLGIMTGQGTDRLTNIENLRFIVASYPDPVPAGQEVNFGIGFTPPAIANNFAHVNGSEVGDLIDLAALYPDAGTGVRLNANGRNGDDTILGHAGGNYIVASAGDDAFDGREGQDTAAFILSSTFAGSLVAEQGAPGVVLVRHLVNNVVGETLFEITHIANGSATIEGFGAAAYLGIDTISNVEGVVVQIEGRGGPFIATGRYTFGAFISGSLADEVIDLADFAGFNNIAAGFGDDTITGNELANIIFAGGGDDTVSTLGGNDEINGEAGDDTVDGGEGTDTFVVNGIRAQYTLTANGLGGYTLTDNAPDYANGGDTGTDTLTNIEQIRFSDETYVIPAGDTITGTAASEMLTGTSGDDTISGLGGNDTLNGEDGDDDLSGDAGIDTINGGEGNDRIDGGDGADIMNGGSGDDTYVVGSLSDVVSEEAEGGDDTIETGLNRFDLAAADNVEALIYTGAGNFTGSGNALANTIVGGDGNDSLDGLAGADTLEGGLGNDRYYVDDEDDAVVEADDGGTDTVFSSISHALAANVEALVLAAGAGAIDGTGNALANTLTGNEADNVLDGGLGADTMVGGLGNDTFIVDDEGDVVSDAGGEDRVETTLGAYTLGSRIEALAFTGEGAFAGTGNSLANTITGGAQGDTLDGQAGADVLIGLAGDDVYVVDNAGDQVIEAVGDGEDSVIAGASWALGAGQEVETLAALAGTKAIDLTGNELANSLNGNDGRNRLDGGEGADQMAGGLGNDTYVIDDAGDAIVEDETGGIDLVETAVDYTLGANLENLTLLVGGLSVNGNAQTNTILGSIGADTILAGDGDDRVQAGDGDDSVTGEAGADRIDGGAGLDVLDGGTGADTLRGGGDADILRGGSENDSLYGDDGDDTLEGGDGNDRLDGGLGADTMDGGNGNDTYYVDNLNDSVAEATGDGRDTVFASISSFGLGANIEGLTFTGSGDFFGVGNASANDIRGGAGQDVLLGMEGADTLRGNEGHDNLYGGFDDDRLLGGSGVDFLVGELGADRLTGGEDADTFFYATVDEIHGDRIEDFLSSDGDVIDLSMIDALTTGGADDAFSWIGTDLFSGTAGELRFEIRGSTTRVSGDIDGDGAADFTLTLKGAIVLSESDFAL